MYDCQFDICNLDRYLSFFQLGPVYISNQISEAKAKRKLHNENWQLEMQILILLRTISLIVKIVILESQEIKSYKINRH